MSTQDLKIKLKLLGAKTTGNKPVLLKRLNLWQDLDLSRSRCSSSCVPSDCQHSFNDDGEPYQELDKLPKEQVGWLNPAIIQLYFNERKAMKGEQQGRKLFHSHFCKTISFSATDHNIFFKIICSAETKKSVDYAVRLHLNNQERSIMKATCACPAGTGTSSACKHVSAALYAIEFYGLMGGVKLNKSCTDKLQTWHQPKAGRNLVKSTVDSMINSSIMMTPTPSTSKTDEYLNSLINFGITTPVYCRNAKLQHVFQDHDYCKDNLMVLHLNAINRVTKKERLNIERKTVYQRVLWNNMRKTRITASICHNVLTTMRTQKYCTAFLKYHINGLNITSNAIKWGLKNEEIARKQYSKITGEKINKCGLFIDEEHNFLAANPDGINAFKNLIIEIKCPFSCRNGKPEDAKYIHGGRLKTNHAYYTQCQIQMHVTKIHKLDFVVWTPHAILIQSIGYDEGMMSQNIVPLKKYFEEHFVSYYFNQTN